MIAILGKYWQYILIALLAIALTISVRSCRVKSDLADLQKHTADSTYHFATEVQLKNGLHAFRIKTLEATVHDLQGADILTTLQINQLKEDKVKLGELVTYYQGKAAVNVTTVTKGKDSVIYLKDSVQQKVKTFDYSGTWLRLHEVYNPFTDSLSRKYVYRVSFQLVSYRKRQGLFKPSQLITDLTFDDPAIQVGEFNGVVVKEPRKRWYETRGFAIGVGIVGGVWLSGKLK